MSKVLDQINKKLYDLSMDYSTGNAHGIPVTTTGSLKLERLDDLLFDQKISVTNPQLPNFLRELANILDEFFGESDNLKGE